ncbi:hypothetical protein [Kitasatospora sp. NPDC059599]|uniref:hypothetical protein n=1 Tax=Kitasatospora sp. NPDC059599 TaxID=3346880 RepID=UPI0036A3F50C
MSTDEHDRFRVRPANSEDAMISAAMGIAARWGEVLGPEKLEVALKALEPQLKREHAIALKRLDMQQADLDRQAQEAREQRADRRYFAGLIVGATVAVAMLGAGVYVAKDAWWLAALLCGPSLLALAKIFVLRRSDAGDMSAVALTARGATQAAQQGQAVPPTQ